MKKACEALAAARLCFEHELYDSAVSRAYYAMFWAAIAALESVGRRQDEWSHGGLRKTFSYELVTKRALFREQLGRFLNEAYTARSRADYRVHPTSRRLAQQALSRAERFVARAEEVIT